MGVRCGKCGSLGCIELPNGSYACASCDYIGSESAETTGICPEAYAKFLEENGLKDDPSPERRGFNVTTALLVSGCLGFWTAVIYALLWSLGASQ